MSNTVYTQMDNKQHSTVVLPKESFENEYQRFIIDATNETGDYVVENAVDEMSAQGVNTSILTDGETPSIAEVSYSTKRKENYIYTVNEEELKSASMSKSAYDELMAKINANLDEQDRKNCWRAFPKLLLKGYNDFKAGQINFSTVQNAYADNLMAMREDIRKIKTPSDLYNAYSKVVSGVTKTLKTFSNRPIIFIRASYLDELEIKYQSGIFNLDKIRIDADIVPVPTFYLADGTTEDTDTLWLTTGQYFAKIYRTFEKRATLEDMRSFNIGKAVSYLEYTSKLVPAILHSKYVPTP